MNTIVDFHTHRLDATAALISVDPRHFDPQPGLCYSVGFHPWHEVDQLTDHDFALLERCARHPQVLAIGETGMDRLRGADLDIQEQVFVRHLHLARETGKPVVVHCVRAVQDILHARHRSALDDLTLCIHAMRGNEHVARTWLEAGCYLSYGPHFNSTALLATPLDRLLIETDDATDLTIDAVAASIAQVLALPIEELLTQVTANTQRLLSLK